jgi:hypothetical protein
LALTVADLFEIAKAFFGIEAVMSVGGLPNFNRDKKRQYITLAAIHDFTRGDGFFKAFGDAPMPSYTPYGITDILLLAKGVIPSQLEDRIKSNAIQTSTIRRTYAPWWQNPELFVN